MKLNKKYRCNNINSFDFYILNTYFQNLIFRGYVIDLKKCSRLCVAIWQHLLRLFGDNLSVYISQRCVHYIVLFVVFAHNISDHGRRSCYVRGALICGFLIKRNIVRPTSQPDARWSYCSTLSLKDLMFTRIRCSKRSL